jgi:hypothetical protein
MTGQSSKLSIDITTANGVTEVETRVQYRLDGLIRHFRLVIVKKGAILRGQARTYYAKQLAQHAVMEAGIPILANQIDVL